MNTTPDKKTAAQGLDQVLTRMSQAELARAMNVTAPAIGKWIRYGVPLPRCPQIEAATGGEVRCEDLRPEVTWHRGHDGRVIGYTVPVEPPAREVA